MGDVPLVFNYKLEYQLDNEKGCVVELLHLPKVTYKLYLWCRRVRFTEPFLQQKIPDLQNINSTYGGNFFHNCMNVWRGQQIYHRLKDRMGK